MVSFASISCGLCTKDLVKTNIAGKVAVIAHEDLDHLAAESLIRAGVVAVVNLSSSITMRYPNGGPRVLEEAKVPLFDIADMDIFDLEKYSHVSWDTSRNELIFSLGEIKVRVQSKLWSRSLIDEAMSLARQNIGNELKAFASNTLANIEKEADDFFAPIEVPLLKTQIKNRHCLVVIRGPHCADDLQALLPYIKENNPAIIAVDGAADLLLEVGLVADIIIGDFDSVSKNAVNGPELVHHIHRDRRAPGKDVLDSFGLPYFIFQANGTSEDVAMLMAYEAGAELIVAVGTHRTMFEFMDKGRKGMASTFLTRMKLGEILVDAQGVSRLFKPPVRSVNVPEIASHAQSNFVDVLRQSMPSPRF